MPLDSSFDRVDTPSGWVIAPPFSDRGGWTEQPQMPVKIASQFRPGMVWCVNAGTGYMNLVKNTMSIPSTTIISPIQNRKGYNFIGQTWGVSPTMDGSYTTNTLTIFSVFILNSAVPWGGIIYDRSGSPDAWSGQTTGGNGQEYRYVWDGLEWMYDTGLTFPIRKLVCAAHSIDPTTVICAVDGKTNVRSGLTNGTRTTSFGGSWFGGDSYGSDRTLNGHILMGGIVVGTAWSEPVLRDFTLNPWQLFSADY